jgi:hypothetical protein
MILETPWPLAAAMLMPWERFGAGRECRGRQIITAYVINLRSTIVG